MNARKMKRRIYQRHGRHLAKRKQMKRYLLTLITRRVWRAHERTLRKMYQAQINMAQAFSAGAKSMDLFTGAVSGVSSLNWANQGLGLPPYHPSLNGGKPEQAA